MHQIRTNSSFHSNDFLLEETRASSRLRFSSSINQRRKKRTFSLSLIDFLRISRSWRSILDVSRCQRDIIIRFVRIDLASWWRTENGSWIASVERERENILDPHVKRSIGFLFLLRSLFVVRRSRPGWEMCHRQESFLLPQSEMIVRATNSNFVA